MALKLIDESLIDALITQAKQIHLNAVDYLETIRNRLLPLPDSSDQEQDELWNEVYLKIDGWGNNSGCVLKQELKSKFTIQKK